MNFGDWLEEEIGKMFPNDILNTLDRDRPYDGQPWTDAGERGKREIKGITMRDLNDCFLRACYDSAPIQPEEYPKSVYDLPWEHIDIMAVAQNMSCWVEKYMNIFPNIPKISENNLFEGIPTLELPPDMELNL